MRTLPTGTSVLTPLYAAPGGEVSGQSLIQVLQKIVDIFDKKNGALEFIVTEVSLSNQNNEPVCAMKSIVVVRN